MSFTGSVRAGRRVAALASETIKKVTLELGGKSACIVLEDAPLEKAIPAAVNNAMLNSGQTCSAWTRMVVPQSRLSDVLELATAAAAKLVPGDPLDPGQVDINGARFNPLAPFGGYKRSGVGREFGRYGLEEYQQIKAIQC